MTRSLSYARALASIVLLASCHAGLASKPSQGAQDRLAISQTLPRLDGEHLGIKLVEVTYPPGASSKPHSHPCAVVAYVVDGAIRVHIKGTPEAVYRAGESFYEPPNSAHLVSANASDKERAKFAAFFTCDRDTALSVPLSESATTPARRP
jgi:quercetin dioxygenase-like cupin family protein